MTDQVFIPPAEAHNGRRCIFLAGPITDAPNWQSRAITSLLSYGDDKLNICSPRREIARSGDFTADMYYKQVDWEIAHLDKSGEKGAILFWLAAPIADRSYPDRSYGQTTRLELGKYVTKTSNSVVVGIEQGFGNERYIRHWLEKEHRSVPIYYDLESTCAAAYAVWKKR